MSTWAASGQMKSWTTRSSAANGNSKTSLGSDVRYFAFPYGQHENLSAAAFRVAFEAGYEGVCSAYGGYNFPGDDPFHSAALSRRP